MGLELWYLMELICKKTACHNVANTANVVIIFNYIFSHKFVNSPVKCKYIIAFMRQHLRSNSVSILETN